MQTQYTENRGGATTAPGIINGIDTALLADIVEAVSQDASKAQTRWKATTRWVDGTHSETQITECHIGGQRIEKDFRIHVDEPRQLGGTNRYPNPQETLFAALNACMAVGYVALCAHEGIELESLRIETEGDIDLRGFLGLDETVKPGYEQIRYAVHIKGNATPAQFEKIHQAVMKTSPNYFNLRNPVPLQSRLIVEE